MFDKQEQSIRPTPEMPPTYNVEYSHAAAWSSSTVDEILRDPLGVRKVQDTIFFFLCLQSSFLGRQVFRCFLHGSRRATARKKLRLHLLKRCTQF